MRGPGGSSPGPRWFTGASRTVESGRDGRGRSAELGGGLARGGGPSPARWLRPAAGSCIVSLVASPIGGDEPDRDPRRPP